MEIVCVTELNDAVTPGGNPVAVPIPLAFVVLCVIEEGSEELMQSVGELDGKPTVFGSFTTKAPETAPVTEEEQSPETTT